MRNPRNLNEQLYYHKNNGHKGKMMKIIFVESVINYAQLMAYDVVV